MNLIQIAEPAIEPVSLVEAKGHLKIDADMTEDDWLITMLIKTARRFAEKYTSRSLINQSWQIVMDAFPGYRCASGFQLAGSAIVVEGSSIIIRNGPVTSITSISYIDTDGNWQTMASTDYIFDPSGLVQRVGPAYGKTWPVPRNQIACVKINYQAGFGATPDKVPDTFRQWMLLRLNTLYENREEVAILGRGKVDPLPFIDGLLDFEKVPVI
ncbi:MAG: head-tail connector protein [Undibacterium umbellatum]|uniref:head-tail connector protein n=1 Tax=Undibacterium umbellatum TaxID=2762300 RepID=UPI003BB50AD0